MLPAGGRVHAAGIAITGQCQGRLGPHEEVGVLVHDQRYAVVKEPAGRARRNGPEPPGPAGTGGDERSRTADPLLAKQVLSRLSYIPTESPAGKAVPPGDCPPPSGGGPFWLRTRDLTLIKRAL